MRTSPSKTWPIELSKRITPSEPARCVKPWKPSADSCLKSWTSSPPSTVRSMSCRPRPPMAPGRPRPPKPCRPCSDRRYSDAGDRWLAGDRRVAVSGARRPIGYPRPGAPQRPGGHSRVPAAGRRTRPCDRCPRSAPGVQPPRAFPLRLRRHLVQRPRARGARPTRHHGRATDDHRGHRHALARRPVLVLAATGRPVAGAGHRSRRLRPAPRQRDRATRRPRAREARPVRHRHHGRATRCYRGHRHALARRDVLVLAATGRPAAGAWHRSLRLRPAPRRRDRAIPARHRHREQHRDDTPSR